jgi:hypothetical protein
VGKEWDMRALAMTLLMAGLMGCGGDEDSATSRTSYTNPVACPPIAIKCKEGYHMVQLRNCNGLCIPDAPNYDWGCTNTADCPAIYCIMAPCPQMICVGHTCMHERTTAAPEKLGEPCRHQVCTTDEYCCNKSCGICAPLDGFCTEIQCKKANGI